MSAEINRASGERGVRVGLRDALLVAVPKLAGGVLALGLNLILLRHLEAAEYGLWGLCIALITLGDSILSGPTDLAVLRLASPEFGARREEIERAALHLKLGVVIIAAVPIVVVSSAFADIPAPGWHLVPLTALSLAAILALRSVLVHLQLEERFVPYCAIESSHVLLKLGLFASLLTLASPRIEWLILALAAGPLVAFAGGAAVTARHLLRFSRAGAQRYRDVGRLTCWYLAAVALGTLIGHLDVLALGWSAAMDALGIFVAGHTLASVPNLLGAYLGVVLTPRVLAAARTGALPRLYFRAQGALFAAGVAAYLAAMLAWDALVELVLPARFAGGAAEIALILLPGMLVAMMTVPMALPIVMFWRKHVVVRMDCVALPVLAALYAIAVPRYGATGAAWVTCSALFIRSAVVHLIALHCVVDRSWRATGVIEDPRAQ